MEIAYLKALFLLQWVHSKQFRWDPFSSKTKTYVHTGQVTLDMSGRPIVFQWDSWKYPGQLGRFASDRVNIMTIDQQSRYCPLNQNSWFQFYIASFPQLSSSQIVTILCRLGFAKCSVAQSVQSLTDVQQQPWYWPCVQCRPSVLKIDRFVYISRHFLCSLIFRVDSLKTFRPSDAYMRQWTLPQLVR